MGKNLSQEYRELVKEKLLKFSEQMISEFKELDTYDFCKEIRVLGFEIHYMCDITMYCMLDTSEEAECNCDEEHFCDIKNFAEGLDDEIQSINDEKYDYEVNQCEIVEEETLRWMSECLEKANLKNITLPMYGSVHDNNKLYNLRENRYFTNEDYDLYSEYEEFE